MLTLQQAEPIAEQLRADVELDMVTAHAIIPDTPMACEYFVSDAMWHLLKGFLIVEKLDTTSRSLCGSVTREFISDNLCTVLKELNHCSIGFWRLPESRILSAARLREFGGGLCKRRRGAPEGKCRHDAAADHAAEMKLPEQFALEFVTQGRVSISNSEWDESLASTILHLVGAYRSMEILSVSAFPSGASDSFELACQCLCTVLVALDACLTGCVE